MTKLIPPLTEDVVRQLKAGDEVEISGVIYTARDMAHRRLCQAIRDSQALPFDIKGAIIYFMAPTPARPGKVIGAAGSTTSSRMDEFSPVLIEAGLRAMMGKGYRNQAVRDSMKKFGAVHLFTIGGAGALISKFIVKSEVIAYDDLGTEAIRRLEVVNFPAIVAYDAASRSIYNK